MKNDIQRFTTICRRSDGCCHICHKTLVRKHYAKFGKRGAWEIEHSVPRSEGGTDHRNNLYPACISCNRQKGNATTRRARGRHGRTRAPFSKAKKATVQNENAVCGAALGVTAGLCLGPVGGVLGCLLGYLVGSEERVR